MTLLSTDEIYTAYKAYSGDPCKQVVCIIFNAQTKQTLAVGYNQRLLGSIHTPEKAIEIRKVMETPGHPAKKLLVVHAETNCLDRISHHEVQLDELAAYVSLQPCVNCLKALAQYGISKVYWKENNRHQQEQEEVKDFIGLFFDEYKQVDSMMLVPSKDVIDTVLEGI